MKKRFKWFARKTTGLLYGDIYRKSLLIVLIITCLPTLLVGIAVHQIGSRHIAGQMLDMHRNHVQQTSVRLDEYLEHLENTTTQWLFNPVFTDNLRKLEQTYDYEYIYDIYKTLFLIRNSDYLIDQSYLVLNGPGKIISDTGGVVPLEQAGDRFNPDELFAKSGMTYWLPALEKPPWNGQKAPAIVYKLPVDSADPYAALLIFLDKGKLNKLIGDMTPGGSGVAQLMTGDGESITEAVGGSKNAAKLAERLHNGVQEEKDFQQSIYTVGGERFSVISGSIKRLGSKWSYVTAASMSELLSPVVFVSRMMYAISFAGLLTAAVLALVASRKLYQPIAQLLGLFRNGKISDTTWDGSNEVAFIEREWNVMAEASETMRRRIELQLPSLRDGFLLQLMQGNLYALSERELQDRMQQLGWEEPCKEFAVLLVRLHGLASGGGRFREGDEQLVSFAATNIVSEVAKSRFAQAEAANFQDMSMGILISFPEVVEHDPMKIELFRLAEELSYAINKLLGMNCTISLGSLTTAVRDIPKAFAEALQAERFRNLNDDNAIIDAADYLRQGSQSAEYPFALETDIIRALRSGCAEEAVSLIGRFAEELLTGACIAFQFRHGMLQLYGNIRFAFLKTGFYPEPALDAELYDQLAQIRDPHEAVRWMTVNVVRLYIEGLQRVSEEQEQQLEWLVEKVIETLHRKYNHNDISLEMCADLYSISPFTLSKRFKQVTGVNFIDYLTCLRLDKAKELLLQTDMKVTDIAERVGYQTTYFNRIFKKNENVTPSQYRDLHRRG